MSSAVSTISIPFVALVIHDDTPVIPSRIITSYAALGLSAITPKKPDNFREKCCSPFYVLKDRIFKWFLFNNPTTVK